MDTDQNLLDDFNAREEAREAAEWKLKKATQERYESAAKRAHAFRTALRLLTRPAPAWEDMGPASQRHLIEDARNVAEQPTISAAELNRLYKERLREGGDTEHEDLQAWTPQDEFVEAQCLSASRNF